MEEFIELKKDETEVNLMPPLTWAYVGDCVYELYIRTKLVNETKLKPHALHIEAIKHVKANHLPKNANVQEYMYSTAFEALIGFLYLTKQNKRLKEILELGEKNNEL